jgi:hypothetical protein
MSKILKILSGIIILGLYACAEKIESISTEISLENNLQPRGRLEHIELDETKFLKLLEYFYEYRANYMMKNLSKLEQEAVFRIHNTFAAHGGRCIENHSFIDSREAENFEKCKFNENFIDQLKELYPEDPNFASVSGYYISDLNLMLWRTCSDNFIPHCKKEYR